MTAEYQRDEQKRETLTNLSPLINTVKILIRLSHNIDILSEKEYIWCQSELQEIGNMLGGWIRSIKDKPQQRIQQETR